MITRLIPLFPYNLQNFAYGITDISFWRYTAYTFLFMLPGVSVATIGAAGLTSETHRVIYLSAAGILCAAVIIAALILKRKFIDSSRPQGTTIK
jgi:uncharacterized membrane protein YdjX (TVP38/TMEM64 family)